MLCLIRDKGTLLTRWGIRMCQLYHRTTPKLSGFYLSKAPQHALAWRSYVSWWAPVERMVLPLSMNYLFFKRNGARRHLWDIWSLLCHFASKYKPQSHLWRRYRDGWPKAGWLWQDHMQDFIVTESWSTQRNMMVLGELRLELGLFLSSYLSG